MVILWVVSGFEVAGALIQALDPEQRAHSFVEGELVDDHVKEAVVRGFLSGRILVLLIRCQKKSPLQLQLSELSRFGEGQILMV